MNLPSIKTLRTVFGDNAKQARAILEMSREELEALPACADVSETCYYKAAKSDLCLMALSALAGAEGVEAFRTRAGYCEYLNMGDAYVPTLLRFGGRYRVACWADIAQQYPAVHVI